MDAREYLSQAFKIHKRIEGKKDHLKRLKAQTAYTGPVYGDVKVQTNMRHSHVEYSALNIVNIENEIEEDNEELKSVADKIRSTIKRVGDSNMENLLEMRYLSFMDWDEVVLLMRYSRSYVFKLHSLALRRIKDLI